MILSILFFLGFLSAFNCAAQSTNLDSVQSITQTTYAYKNGQRQLSILKESQYDTNQILIQQNRYNYVKVDTGFAAKTHYYYTYNPRNKRGSFYTETLANSARPNQKYSKKESSFKSYDHGFKRLWQKAYKKDSKMLLRQIENSYDANGQVISTKTTNYDTSPPNSSSEKVKRNAVGNIINWESFDDDGDTKMQARSFQASYKNDTLLLKSSGYLYFNWNETINKYNGKNELKKSIQSVGNRQQNGKVKRTAKTITIYKNNQPYKTIAKELNKKVKTTIYVFETNREVQQITTPSKTYEEVKTYTYLDSACQYLTNYTETLEGKAFLKKEMTYDTTTNKMIQYIEIEHRENGKDWKIIKDYNAHGNVAKIQFFIADKLTKEDIYEYTYFPPPPPEEEETEDK